MTRDDADDIRRHFDVLAEHLQSQNQQLAEGIAGTHERIDRVDTRMGRVEIRMERVELRVTALDAKVGGLDGQVGTLRSEVGTLGTKVDRVEHRLDDLTTEVRQGFAGLGALIQTTYGRLDARLTRNEAEDAETRSEVDKIKARLAS